MFVKRITAGIAAAVLGAAPILAAAPAEAAPGNRSLATVLAQDGQRFDRNWGDFDVLDKAVGAVLVAKPDSAVAVLADGDTRLTAFLPTDRAFRILVHDLTGERKHTERAVFKTLVDAAGVDTIESVLLYHVVPGSRIGYAAALRAAPVRLTTALGPKIGVRVAEHNRLRLPDADRTDRNATVIRALRNINGGNLQFAHGIDRVLRPIDLP